MQTITFQAYFCAPMKKIGLLVAFMFQGVLLFSQNNNIYFDSWKSLKRSSAETFEDLVQVRKRPIPEIRVYGGNDYEILTNTENITTKTIRTSIFAIRSRDSLFLNGEKLKLAPFYCKVLLEGNYMVFQGSITKKEQDHYDEITAIYGASGGFEARFIAETNEKRHLYYLNMSQKKPKPILLDRFQMRKLLENKESLIEQYNKEKDLDNLQVILRYVQRLNEIDKTKK